MEKQTARIALCALFSIAGASVLFGHYTWVAPAAGVLEVGRAAVIRMCHGHSFPAGEETLNVSGAEAMVIDPAGGRTKLTPVANPQGVTATYTPRQTGLHRVVYVQDRGVISRTAKGVKPGGRDKNPDAAQAFRSYRSAVAYLPAGTPQPVAPKPLGIESELTGVRTNSAWELQLLTDGKPRADVMMQVFAAGTAKALDAGKTDAHGKLVVRHSAAQPVLFSAEWKDKAPSGAAYDTVNYSTSLYVTQ